MPNYGEAEYWEDRYSKHPDTTFDWLEEWKDIKDIVNKYCLDLSEG